MRRLFGFYSVVVVLLFALANHEGYTVSSLWGDQYRGKPGDPGYQRLAAVRHK